MAHIPTSTSRSACSVRPPAWCTARARRCLPSLAARGGSPTAWRSTPTGSATASAPPTPAPTDRGGAGSAGAALLATVVEEVDEHVVAEGVGVGEEGAATVDAHHLLDERLEVVA